MWIWKTEEKEDACVLVLVFPCCVPLPGLPLGLHCQSWTMSLGSGSICNPAMLALLVMFALPAMHTLPVLPALLVLACPARSALPAYLHACIHVTPKSSVVEVGRRLACGRVHAALVGGKCTAWWKGSIPLLFGAGWPTTSNPSGDHGHRFHGVLQVCLSPPSPV